MYTLHIADKPYSSWSLRGWLLLRAFGLPFREQPHRLYEPEFETYQASLAPARQVPALEWEEGGARVLLWDSLAMAETLAERHPQAGHWPEAPAARALARSLTAEMHSGFGALRAQLSMNLRRDGRKVTLSEETRADLARLEALWTHARDRFGGDGPYLFGADFTAADAFFAPIVGRIRPYGVEMNASAMTYLDALAAHPAMVEWIAAARADPRRIARYEAL